MSHITLSQLTTVLQRIVSWAGGKFAAKNTVSGKLDYADMPVVVLASMGAELDGTSTGNQMSAGSTYFAPALPGISARINLLTSSGQHIKISDPESNVIYCNAYTGLLYRWDSTTSRMVPVGGDGNGLREVYVSGSDFSSLDTLYSNESSGVYQVIDQSTQMNIGILVVSCDNYHASVPHFVTQWLFSNLVLSGDTGGYSGSIDGTHYMSGKAHIVHRFYNVSAPVSGENDIPLNTWSEWKVYGLTLDEIAELLNTKANDSAVVKSISVNGTAQTKDTNGNVNVVVPTVILDDAPTAGSPNGVKSGGVKQAIDEKLSQVTVNAIPAGSVAIIDDLTTGGSTNALSAEQGKLLDERVEELELGGGGGVSVSYNASTKTTNIVVGAGASAETTPTPVISVSDVNDGKQVTITAATGAVIRYTTDGSDPTSSSPVYSSPITINTAGTHTIKAVAKVSGKLMSDVATETVTLAGTEQPTIDTSETASAVTVTATLAGATVYISTDGESWTSGSGSASLTINKTTSEQQVTIYAYAKASGMIASQTVTQSVTVAELPNNKLSGTASAALTAITINGTTYTNTQSATDPYIVNTQNGSVYDWEIDFGDTAFGSSIKSGTASKSIFYDGTTDNGNKITKITHMPDSWTSIGTYAFFCANLTQVSYGKNLATISGSFVFYSTKLASVEGLPSTLTSITSSNGQPAFKVGESIAGVSVSIPDTVHTLSASTFSNNAKINSIYVGAWSIGDMVFMATSSGALNVVFGPNVASVGKFIFNDRSNIKTIEFLGNPPSFTDQSKFLSNGQAIPSGLRIIVPQGMLATYQSALSSLSSYIEEKSE